MSDELIPGLPAVLRARAEASARADHARRRRRHWRTAFTALGAAALVSTGAYAARSLWQPELGTQSTSSKPRAVASAEPPEQALLRRMAVLRREQTDADRGLASRSALKLPADNYRVLTGSVRRLGTLPDGRTAVLVPLISQTTDEHRLCLAVGSERRVGSRTCGPARGVLDGGLVFGTGVRLPKALQRKQAAAFRQAARRYQARVKAWRQAHPGRRRLPMHLRGLRLQTPPEVIAASKLRVIGVVPDGVAQVRLGTRGPVVPVRDNLFAVTAPESVVGGLTATFLDAAGRELPPMVAAEPVPPLTPEVLAWLDEAARAQLGVTSPTVPIAGVADGLREACAVQLARPRTTEEAQRAAVAKALAPYAGPLDGRRLLIAKELVALWCGNPDRPPRRRRR